MTAGPGHGGADDLRFRTLAAPGLDEDDLFAALYGFPGAGVLWGHGVPPAFPPGDDPWDALRERRRRHADLLGRWPPLGRGIET